jgi:hypothetical protein
MNSKRRAELQRKLSIGEVPRPPEGLAERIKADIPKYLTAEAERQRISNSVAFSMRVAASLILLITSVFVTLHLLEPGGLSKRTSMAANTGPELVPAVTRYAGRAKTADTAGAQPAEEEVRLEIAQDAAAPSVMAPASVPPPPPPPAARRAAAPETQVAAADSANEAGVASGFVGSVAGGVAGGVVGGASEETVRQTAKERAEEPRPAALAEADFAPVPPHAVPSPVPAPARAARDDARRERITMTAAAPSIVSQAFGDELSLQQPKSIFGISVDPAVFQDIRADLQNGERPSAGRVDVDALVNYFAGAPARPPRRGVSLEVEASPAPVAADGDQAILRFTVDTAKVDVPPRGSVPPAATDVRLDIDVDQTTVESFHRIGGKPAVGREAMLLHNVSVTGLYELSLRPHLKSTDRIATVRLTYRGIEDGRDHSVERVIRGRDLARDWARASRRHRLASLGAVWSETLKGTGIDIDIARRAEELATQNPRDERARDLANAASASTGGGG